MREIIWQRGKERKRERKEGGWERYKDKISENPRIGKKWSDTEREREREREAKKNTLY